MFNPFLGLFASARSNDTSLPRPSATRSGLARLMANRPNLTLWLGCLAIILGITAIFTVELRSRYYSAIAHAERVSQSFADVLAEHTARTFEAIVLTLQAAGSIRNDLLAGRITAEKANEALQNLQKSSPALLALGWTNEFGDVVAHSYKGKVVRSNISDLRHFKVQRDTGDAGLFIAPLYRSHASDQLISAVSLRLNKPDGSFAGAVTAPLDLKYFTNIYRSIKLGLNDTVTLMLRDGTILTREPLPKDAADRSYGSTVLFSQLLDRSSFGVFGTLSPIDGIDRIAAYRVITSLPLIVIVSQDRSEVLAEWHGHLRSFGPMVGLLVLVVVAGAISLARKSNQIARGSTLFAATLENMHQGLIVVDQTDRIAIYNARVLAMLDLPDTLLANRPLSRELIEFQTARGEFNDAPDSIKARILPRVVGEIENVYERTRPNGTVLEIRTVPFSNGGVVRTYKDITDWKQIERELSDRERQFRLLAENATDIIARLNFEGILLYISPSCQSTLGYSADEMRGDRIMNYMFHDDIKPTRAQFAAIRQGKPQPVRHIEYRFRHKLGHWIWLEASPKLICDEAGNPLEFVDVVREITDRKAIEADSLLARQQAEHAAQVQAQFLATMSHELRTPLNSIIGFSGLVLERQDLAPDVRRQIGLIQTASDTLLTVVNDVLDFSKIQEGKLDLVSTVFDIRKLTEDAVEIVRGSAVIKSLDISVSVDDRVNQHLVGDDQRIRQVLLNFLNNAIKFTPHGRVSLDVLTLDQRDGYDTLRFSVTDTGIGIAADKLDRLFQRFSQVDGSTSREYGGSGLGLAICKRLIEMMGGTIGVDTTVGRGSTFWAVLNLSVGSRELPGPAKTDSFATRFPSARLLLVEDVDVNREIAMARLRAAGYDVHTAADGFEAIAAVESGHYDLILMDIQMPGMDGLTATKTIRALSGKQASVPIIAMTANVLRDQIDQFLNAGMNGHIGKPFKIAHAGSIIDKFLSETFAIGRTALAQTDLPTSPIDDDALATLHHLLGREKIDQLLATLAAQLREFLSTNLDLESSNDLSIKAHRLVGSAGMLGFTQLSERCAVFEQDLANSQTGCFDLDAVRSACANALTEISVRLERST